MRFRWCIDHLDLVFTLESLFIVSRDGIIRIVRGSSWCRVQCQKVIAHRERLSQMAARSMSEWFSVGGEMEGFGPHSPSGGL